MNFFYLKLKKKSSNLTNLVPHGRVPPTIVGVPELDVPLGGDGQEHVVRGAGVVEGGKELLLVGEY